MNVLIIPEDVKNDQFILKPIFARLLKALGASSVKVQVCQNPRLRGVAQALNSEQLAQIVNRYGSMADLIILCVDRDGITERRQRLNNIEIEFGAAFLAENAWEELEAWVLAAMIDLPSEWPWAEIRGEVQVKETYFDPYVIQRDLAGTLGGGRKVLGEEASRRVRTIRQKCPEDFDSLALRLQKTLT